MRKMIVGSVAVMLILGTLYWQPVRGADIYVSPTGVDGPLCGTQAAPCRTITNAYIWRAFTGDTIHVAPGTYTTPLESFPITVTINLTLQGAGASTTIIDAGGGGVPPDAIRVTGGATVNVSGFTIGNAGAAVDYRSGSTGTVSNNILTGSGWGLRITTGSNPTIQNNTITSNSDGVYADASSPAIRNNTITGNGGGILLDTGSNSLVQNNTIIGNMRNGIKTEDLSIPTIEKNTISGNGYHGIQAVRSDPQVFNNVIHTNGWSGLGLDWSSAIITNNTIVGNTFYGVHVANTSTPTVTNNIISSNQQYGIYVGSGTATHTYNDVWGNGIADYFGTAAGTGDISVNPDLSGDFHLYCGSPVIDMGTDTPPGGVPTDDKDGNPRPAGAHYDMGAYEGCVPKLMQQRKMPSLLPLASNNVTKAGELTRQAEDLLGQAKAKNLDVVTCEKLIDEAKELLFKAGKSMASPITANYFALKAAEKLREAIDCLKTLLG